MQKCRNTYLGITQIYPAGYDRFSGAPGLVWVGGRKSRKIYDVGLKYFLYLHLFFVVYLVKPESFSHGY